MPEVILHEGQFEVASDSHRFRIVCAGRRWGKSVLARMIVLQWATKTPGLYWIVSPTYKQAKMIHWRDMQKEVPREWVIKKNEVELSFTLKNGSVIELKGAENPDALRGVKLRGLVIDEIASIRNWEWLWSEVLRPTLTDFSAPAIFISTPKGYNHFYELFEQGQDISDNYKSWRFTSYENPYIPKGEIDNAKTELTEDTFGQEYLADFRKFTGLVHKPWEREVHLIELFSVPTEWVRGRGFDYGSTHFTASIRMAIDSDSNWFLERCYLDNKREIEEHANAIRAQDHGLGVVPKWGDPSGGQWFREFAKYRVDIQPANKEAGQDKKGWVEFCVEKVNEMLMPRPGHLVILPDGRKIENAPRMFVLDIEENKPFVKQIENLKWRTSIKGEDSSLLPLLDESEDPVKGGHYDLMAALRYFAVSHKQQSKADELPKQWKAKDWKIGA